MNDKACVQAKRPSSPPVLPSGWKILHNGLSPAQLLGPRPTSPRLPLVGVKAADTLIGCFPGSLAGPGLAGKDGGFIITR